MLFSERKERENRFILSLRIAIPFILVILFFGYFFIMNNKYFKDDIILFTILILCYVYYVVYLLYFAFKKSLIDPVTKTFNRDEIIKIISKMLKKQKTKSIVLLRVKNINDINERYGHKNGDQILKKFIFKFNEFMEKEGFSKLIIGRYAGGNFLFIDDCKIPKLEHILKTFEARMSNEGINNVEINLNFATILTEFGVNLHHIINELFFKINHQEDGYNNILKSDTINQLVCYAIDKMEFEIKFQTLKSLKNKENLYKIYIKINSKELGTISKNKVTDIVTKNGYEIKYDIQILKFIAQNIDFMVLKSKILVEILPVSIRNIQFKNELIKLIGDKKIDPEKIIFEFHEKQIYNKIQRFSEIINGLKNIGFSFALNNFLGNNAGMIYFKFLPLDYIIYDIEFNKSYKNDKIFKIFANFNTICKDLGIKSIVRFVDKESFYNELQNSEVDYLQGFYINKQTDIKNFKGLK